MAARLTLQMPVASVLVLALALLLQCLGSGDSNSCAPEAASEFALDVSDDEASLMQLGEKVVRRRLHDSGASVDAVADRATWNAAAEEAATIASVAASSAASRATNTNLEEDGTHVLLRQASSAPNVLLYPIASVVASSAASRATNTNMVAAPSKDAVSDGVVPSTPIWLPRNLAAAPTNDAVMGAFVNISLWQDSATDSQPKTHPQLAAKVEGVPDLGHKDTLSGISLASKTIQDLWHKVAFVAEDSATQETSAGHSGLTYVIIAIAGITLLFIFFSLWGDGTLHFMGRSDRPRPRNISSIPGRIGSPQPARQAAVQQPTHWWHPEAPAGQFAEEAGVLQGAEFPRPPASHSQQVSAGNFMPTDDSMPTEGRFQSPLLRQAIPCPQTSSSTRILAKDVSIHHSFGLLSWTAPSAGLGLQTVESLGSLEKTTPEQEARMPATQLLPSSPLLPELHGAIVPANRKFIVQVPSLLHLSAAKTVQVTTNHGEPLFLMNLSRHTPSAREAVVIEEYFSISLPDEIDKELLVCTFGRPRGPQLQCEIHKSDGLGHSTLFGVMYEEPANAGVVPYSLFLASGRRLLTVMVNGNVKDRQVKILDFKAGGEVAAAVPGDTGEWPYKVECYPHSDVTLSVIALTIVDRLAAAGM